MRVFSNTQEGRYTMCNVCQCCNARNTRANDNGNQTLCASLWDLLWGNCIATTNTNGGNNTGCGCGNGCGCGCWQNCCVRRRCCGCGNCATANTVNTTDTINGDLYYAYQYGLIPRSGGVCGNTTNTCGCGCGYTY